MRLHPLTEHKPSFIGKHSLGDIEPLRLVPNGKIVVLGLIITEKPKLEKADYVVRSIDGARIFSPLENLTLKRQCGLASTAEYCLLTEDEQGRS
jgi:5-methyltetrahydropteroyltriglutamate--homocysteine methyltransferase